MRALVAAFVCGLLHEAAYRLERPAQDVRLPASRLDDRCGERLRADPYVLVRTCG